MNDPTDTDHDDDSNLFVRAINRRDMLARALDWFEYLNEGSCVMASALMESVTPPGENATDEELVDYYASVSLDMIGSYIAFSVHSMVSRAMMLHQVPVDASVLDAADRLIASMAQSVIDEQLTYIQQKQDGAVVLFDENTDTGGDPH